MSSFKVIFLVYEHTELSGWSLMLKKQYTDIINIMYCCCCLVAKSCQTVSKLVDCRSPRFPVLHDFLKSAQTYVHWVGNTVQPSHCLFPTSPPASVFPSIRVLSNKLLFTSGGQSIGASASVLPTNIQGWFPLGSTGLIILAVQGTLKSRFILIFGKTNTIM